MIRAEDFYIYFQQSECPRRLWLREKHPDWLAPPSEFEEILFRRGREHEAAHLSTFPEYVRPRYPVGDLAKGARATAQLIASREPVIYQGVLRSTSGDMVGIPDFLIRQGDSYSIREAKLATNLKRHPEIAAQIGLYAKLLENTTGAPPTHADVIMGNGEIARVIIPPVTPLLEKLDAIKTADEEPDEAVGWSKCKTCGFLDYCWTNAAAAHDPGVVPEISQSLRNALRAQGIRSYDPLLAMPLQDLANMQIQKGNKTRRLGEKTARKVIRQVRVLATGQIEIIRRPEPLPQGATAYFDIESNPWDEGMETRIYLWGLLLKREDGSTDEYWGTLAPPGDEGDSRAWRAFLEKSAALIKESDELSFVHYGTYEKTWISQYIKRWGDPGGIAREVLSRLWDMEKKAVKGRLCLPVRSYGLKDVEKCAGFRRSQEDYGSLWSIGRYNAYIEATSDSERRKIEEELLTYNKEDCVAMRDVLRWIGGLG